MSLVVVHVTTPAGEVLGHVDLDASDLTARHAAHWIGQSVLDELPAAILEAARDEAARSRTIAPPDGLELRTIAPLSPTTLQRRPLANFAGDLRRLVDRGAGERWLTAQEAAFGSASGLVYALAARGALLIAERGSRRMYRLTPRGVEAAR